MARPYDAMTSARRDVMTQDQNSHHGGLFPFCHDAIWCDVVLNVPSLVGGTEAGSR
jgi:hypothetical protein